MLSISSFLLISCLDGQTITVSPRSDAAVIEGQTGLNLYALTDQFVSNYDVLFRIKGADGIERPIGTVTHFYASSTPDGTQWGLNWSAGDPGAYEIIAYFRDAQDNVIATSAPYAITIAPATAIIAPTSDKESIHGLRGLNFRAYTNSLANGSDLQFRLTYPDSIERTIETVTYHYATSVVEGYQWTTKWDTAAPGTYALRAYYRDSADRILAVSEPYPITVNPAVATIRATSHTTAIAGDTSLKFDVVTNAVASSSNVLFRIIGPDGIERDLDELSAYSASNLPEGYVWSRTWTAGYPGTYSLVAYYRDTNDNILAKSAPYDVVVEPATIVHLATSTLDGAIRSQKTIRVQTNAAANGSDVLFNYRDTTGKEYSIGTDTSASQNGQGYEWSMSWTPANEGDYTVIAYYRNAADQVLASTNQKLTRFTQPTLSVYLPTAEAVSNKLMTVRAKSTGALPTNADVYFTAKLEDGTLVPLGADTTPSNGEWSLSVYAPFSGTYQLLATLRDGNDARVVEAGMNDSSLYPNTLGLSIQPAAQLTVSTILGRSYRLQKSEDGGTSWTDTEIYLLGDGSQRTVFAPISVVGTLFRVIESE